MDDELKKKIERLKKEWAAPGGLGERYAPLPPPGQVEHYEHEEPKRPQEKKAAESRAEAVKELVGLGLIGIGPADQLQARVRAGLAHDKSKNAVEERQFMGEGGHAGLDAVGLGVLAQPYASKLLKSAMLACVDELNKLGEASNVSEEDARRSLDRLETLERNKPTPGQVGRYATLGALAGPAVGAVGNVLKGKSPLDFGAAEGVSKLRGLAAESVKGALTMGAVPLVRGAWDRKGEEGKLRKYVAQHDVSSPTSGESDMQKAAATEVFQDLQVLLADPEFLKTASTEEIAELAKVAIDMAAIHAASTS